MITLLLTFLLASTGQTWAQSVTDTESQPDEPDVAPPEEFCAETTTRSGCVPRLCDDSPHVTISYPPRSVDVAFFPYCRETWQNAQAVCEKHGGRLWEPTSQAEYDAVFAGIGYAYPNPTWFTNSWWSYIHYWIGFENFDSHGPGAFHASNGNPSYRNPNAMNEHQVNQDCVDIYANSTGGLRWGDHHCSLELAFICEIEQACFCIYNGVQVPCGKTIDIFPKCCLTLTCTDRGHMEVTQETDAAGRPQEDCCEHKGELFIPGVVYHNKHMCCEGDWTTVIHKP